MVWFLPGRGIEQKHAIKARCVSLHTAWFSQHIGQLHYGGDPAQRFLPAGARGVGVDGAREMSGSREFVCGKSKEGSGVIK